MIENVDVHVEPSDLTGWNIAVGIGGTCRIYEVLDPSDVIIPSPLVNGSLTSVLSRKSNVSCQ